MDMASSDPKTPVDMDLAWTQWALGSLAELVDIHLRTARMTAAEQSATPILRTKPDFALAQVRLARSVRLSIAMSQRVRETYQDRKAGKAAVPERTPAEEAVAEAATSDVATAEAAPAAGPKDGEPRVEPREIPDRDRMPGGRTRAGRGGGRPPRPGRRPAAAGLGRRRGP